jgi:hypothetical protein
MGGAARLYQVSNVRLWRNPGEPGVWPAFYNPSFAPM